jgi:hypothetical protein
MGGVFHDRVRAQRHPDVRSTFEWLRKDFRYRLWGLEVEWDDVREECVTHADLIELLVRRYAEAHGKATAGVWVDHTPSNMKRAMSLLDMFPSAKFIHVVRDGRAVAASICPLDWGPNSIANAAPWWTERTVYGLAAEQTLGPARALRARYEDIVLTTHEAIRRITDFVGLEFHSSMLEASGFAPPVFTHSEHALVGRPPDRARVDAWRTSLTDRQVEIFESMTGDLLRCLGYEPRFGMGATPVTLRERVGQAISEVAGRCANKVRRSRRRDRARHRIATAGAPERLAGATGSLSAGKEEPQAARPDAPQLPPPDGMGADPAIP